MPTTHHHHVLILGSGPAGLTAAIYAARAGLKPVLVHGMEPGGQMTTTTDVENYPGFAKAVQGPWLMEQMQQQAEHVGTQFVHDLIIKADLSKRPFTLTGDSGDTYTCDALIISTGASAKWLGLPSEKKFNGYGVSACATCDGAFFKKQKVLVIGGGNTAVEEALYLANIADEVTLIHRRDTLRAEKIGQQRLFNNPRINVIWDTALEEVMGDEEPLRVRKVRLKNVKTGQMQELEMDGVFVAIGHHPNTDLFKGQLDMDETGYLKTTPGSTKTKIPGVFAAGDVQDPIFRQAVTAAGSGCMAALEAEKYLGALEVQTKAA